MKACRGPHCEAATREVRRKVAAFKRKGWTRLLPDDEYVPGFFTRELLLSADGKWIAKFSECQYDDIERDAWAALYAPFCHDVHTGKTPIAPDVRPLLPAMPLFRRGKYIAVAIIERLAPFVEEGDTRTSAERKASRQYSDAKDTLYDLDRRSTLRGPVGTLMRTFQRELKRMPDDLHCGNVMLRRGPRGGRPKLVFTDPYAYVLA